jgi:beta-glucosidase
LSYTQFKYSAPELSTRKLSARALNEGHGEPLRVSADVTNTGSRAGDETVQLYIREQGTSVARPVRELKGFQRISLQPGATKRAEFALGRDELRFWNVDMKNTVEPAHVTVCAGPSSAAGECAEFEITD